MCRYWLLKAFLIIVTLAVPTGRAQTPVSKLNKLADRYVEQQLSFDPTLSYSTGLPTRDHSRFAERTEKAIASHEAEEREDLKDLLRLPQNELATRDRATYANLREQLEADLQLRVCRTELWDVNHFDGWQSHFAEVAERQPVTTIDDRKQALQRWSSLPRYIDVEIANLRLGIVQGYSVPQSVVGRVIKQIDTLALEDPEKSPFYSPALRSRDTHFQEAFRGLIVTRINPALKLYRDFLQLEYLPKARESIAVGDLPNGTACYQAFLRSNTTLMRTPKEIFDLGQQAVRENVAEIAKLGTINYGTTNLQTIVARVKSRPQEHFQSKEELLAFSRQFLQRAKDATAAHLVTYLPTQDVVIRPLSTFEEDAGVGSRFQAEPNPRKPAVYLIKLSDWRAQTRADAEIVTVHETVPGHYLQKALGRELQPSTRLSKLVDNPAYAEGWARYAEALGEEARIYDSADTAIMRRLWPARGMVVDPGLHAFHWTRQQAIDYMVSSAHFTAEEANNYVDRIAVMPGQLTAYDCGGLEIRKLRSMAEAQLGSRFDVRRFNRAVLEEGVVPLEELRVHVESWIASQLRSK